MNLNPTPKTSSEWTEYICKNTIEASLIKTFPDNISPLYKEIILCLKEKCFTATILLMRKMLVHIAIYLDDKPHESFYEYVNYIQNQISLSETCIDTLNHLRTEANQVSHELSLASSSNVLSYLYAINEVLTKNLF